MVDCVARPLTIIFLFCLGEIRYRNVSGVYMLLLFTLGGELLFLNGRVSSQEEGIQEIMKVLGNGDAMKRFQRMLRAQGVSEEVSTAIAENPESVLPLSKHTTQLYAFKTGMVTGVDPLACAEVSSALGAGRTKPMDKVTHNTGLKFQQSVGDLIEKDQPWITVYHVEDSLKPHLKQKLEAAISISDAKDAKDGRASKIHCVVRDGCANKPIMQCQ